MSWLADPDGVLEAAANPDGTRRFYPAGAHPATHQLRERLFSMRRVRALYHDDKKCVVLEGNLLDIDDAIDYVGGQIAKFERLEDLAKIGCLVAHYRQIGLE